MFSTLNCIIQTTMPFECVATLLNESKSIKKENLLYFTFGEIFLAYFNLLLRVFSSISIMLSGYPQRKASIEKGGEPEWI